MFSFRRRETPSLQLYGKLPLAKDYLRLGLGDGAGLALRDWLDATFSSGASREDAPVLAWPFRFLIGDAFGGCLQGIVQPSSDAGGLRPFPFALVVERHRRAVVDDMQQALATCAAVWLELAVRHQQCASFADGRSLLDALRGTDLAIAELAKQPPAAVDLEAWLAALWPGTGRTGLERDLERLAAVGGGEPIRLPLATGCSQRQQVLAWIEILARLGLTAARECPTIFLPAASSVVGEPAAVPAFVTIYRAAPRARDGDWLSLVRTESLGPGDLVAGRPAAVIAGPPVAEGSPPLATSLLATVTNYLRRRRGAP